MSKLAHDSQLTDAVEQLQEIRDNLRAVNHNLELVSERLKMLTDILVQAAGLWTAGGKQCQNS